MQVHNTSHNVTISPPAKTCKLKTLADFQTSPTLRETHTKTLAADPPKNNNNRLIQTKDP
jgi:hypothetical protein